MSQTSMASGLNVPHQSSEIFSDSDGDAFRNMGNPSASINTAVSANQMYAQNSFSSTNISPPAPKGPPPAAAVSDSMRNALRGPMPPSIVPNGSQYSQYPIPQPEILNQGQHNNQMPAMNQQHFQGGMNAAGMPPMQNMMFSQPPNMPIMPGMPLSMSGRFPMPMPMPPMPMQQQHLQNFLPGGGSSQGGNNSVAMDPNNDVSCWSEHINEAEDRKYWYNRATLVSTYEKPFCLKTPEERSIPPCPWKEYSSPPDATGMKKKYYSNGTESTWVMPEEYRIWKEKIEAVGKKKPTVGGGSKHDANKSAASAASAESKESKSKASREKEKEAEENAEPLIVYATHAEALEAFHELLALKKVSANSKMKEVLELCQDDPRWDALKILSQGDKKQGLAEYQTKKLKQEKDVQKAKARKHRDAFLLMLAENTDIDARTRWRDAMEILQEDQRYKNVEDTREREDLFRDFCLELEKKEKEDRRKQREAALEFFQKALQERHSAGGINWRSVWADCKKEFVDVICRPELKCLEDSDLRRCFQEFAANLEEQFRREERKRKEELQRTLDLRQTAFAALLDSLTKQGLILPETRWKDLSLRPELTGASAYTELCALYQPSPTGGVMAAGGDTAAVACCREIFEKCLQRVQDSFRGDKRLLKDLMHDCKLSVAHDSSLEWFRMVLLRLCKDYGDKEGSGASMTEKEAVDRELEAMTAAVAAANKAKEGVPAVTEEKLPSSSTDVAIEEGEEIDDSRHAGRPAMLSSILSGSINSVNQLRKLLLERHATLAILFKEQKAKAVAEYEEEQRFIRKMEGRFLSLLEDCFYLSDHVGTSWDDAKKVLQKRSAYDSVGKTDRKRLFQKHMENLAAKMESKAKSIKILIDSREQQQLPPPIVSPPSQPRQGQDDKESSAKAQPVVASSVEADGYYDIEKEMQDGDAAAADGDADSEEGDDKDKVKDKEDKLKDKDSKEKDKDRHSKKHKKEKKHKKHSKRDRSQSPETPAVAAAGGAEGVIEGTAAKRQRSLSIDK
eukprot:CAMPEP_0201108498 /NCGR_PEP_ID=MMETSP0812-20130820/61864_1 /ASSEMBLY_ACC=CAM_ASM_000668 /TAXON_ID=98059 /ORGANISM="Dinobryon sp., Strain UTEXLB2267" /LENGTH=1019 /DNA_ID=CAMNT_0047369973 /DNA_START=23 /DNA_END=3082 /DNA_ORIENTATION=+